MRISDWSSDVCSSDLEFKKEVITYAEAVKRAGWHHSDDRTGEILDKLPYYGELLAQDIPPGTQIASDPLEKRCGEITNTNVHIGMRLPEQLANANTAEIRRQTGRVRERQKDKEI